MNFTLLVPGSYSADTVILVAGAAFAIGYLIKTAVLLKQRKRILRLEDEMLANHARILSLEKRASERRTTLNGATEFEVVHSKKTSVAS